MNERRITVGALQAITALGEGVARSVARMRQGGTALRPTIDGLSAEGRIDLHDLPTDGTRARGLLHRCLGLVFHELGGIKPDERWGCFIASTKGDIGMLAGGAPLEARLPVLAASVQERFGFVRKPWMVSNACASGVSAIALAGEAIQQGYIDHAVVVGVDILSRFTTDGFRALFALDPGPCKPFDAQRKGTSLGEACGALVLTHQPEILPHAVGTLEGAGIAQDANHLSGPSRTGEGLVRAIGAAMRSAGVGPADITAINAHGTATPYNDPMECIAFERCGLAAVPTSGYKGWFGHTLGAAGVVESVLALHALGQGLVLRNAGMQEPGFSDRIRVIDQDLHTHGRTLLKTSSGFGGINAAAIFQAAHP